MCGICGLYSDKPVLHEKIRAMTNLLKHRGPDDEGILIEKNVGLGHRRLSIIDLSSHGHQPMSTNDKKFWITYNGEIYNYIELREELKQKGYVFESDSDTEVILYSYKEWGYSCVKKFNGMWAFVVWDKEKDLFFCSRDRLGVKPFYYYFDGEIFVFASEIKPLLDFLSERKINENLIFDFLKVGILEHTDETFFKGIKKLLPAHNLVFKNRKIEISKYWDFSVLHEYKNNIDDADYSERFRALFVDAVRLRLRSDVSVGSCLSGGLDSSSIVCVMADLLRQTGFENIKDKLKTFSACFNEKKVDERQYIENVISHTTCEKNYIFPTPSGFLEELDDLLDHQEEPFAGASMYSQRCVFKKAASENIKVLLDGQGGDELLLGYRKFYIMYFIHLFKEKKMFKLLQEIIPFLLSFEILRTMEFKTGFRYLKKLSKTLSIDDFFKKSGSKFQFSSNYFDLIKEDTTQNSLPALLRYEDKNSMTYAIETRLPFLDYRVVELVSSMPLSQKLRRGWTKYVLRNAMDGILPSEIKKRKSKLGFSVPEEKWMRNEFKDVIQDTFNNADFLPEYVNMDILLAGFNKFLNKKGLLPGSFFFRFFILEKWAKKFL